jgi:Uma2 family endonuclease
MVADLKDVPRPFYTLDEYFALEHAGDARYEYWDGDIVCMSGGSEAHTQICGNVFFRLRLQLSGGPGRAFTAGLPVKTPTLPPYRYPDVTVACGELKYEHIRGVDALMNPALIVEVLSPSSEARDREDKFTAYQAIPTFGEYLLVAQDTPRVIHYIRQSDSKWMREDLTDLDAGLTLASIDCTLSLRDVYEEVKFKSV